MGVLRNIKGKSFLRELVPGPDKCGDCSHEAGDYHDLGCDMEPCPRCGEQLITCDCKYVEPAFKECDSLPEAIEFACNKDVISISTRTWSGLIMVTVFYWKET